MEFDLSRPEGERVVAVRVGGNSLDLSQAYSVTTLDFLASGADLYSGFTGAKVFRGEGPEFAELLEARFATGEPVSAPPGGRLIPVE